MMKQKRKPQVNNIYIYFYIKSTSKKADKLHDIKHSKSVSNYIKVS